MPADASLTEEDGPTVAHPDRCGGDGEQRAQEDQRDRGADDVDHALDRALEVALAVVHNRLDQESPELFLQCTDEDALLRVARHAHGLPLVGRDRDDRVEVAGRARREADGDLVDDLRAEDPVQLVDRTQNRPRQRHSCPRILVGDAQVADDSHAEGGMILNLVGKGLRQRPGADDEHVAGVATATAERLEPAPQEGAAAKGDEELGGEKQHQEEAADVVLVEEEEERQGECQHHDRAAQDVAGLRQKPPAHPEPIQAEGPEDRDPGDSEQKGRRSDVEPDRPHRGGVALESHVRDAEEDERRRQPVSEHDQQRQRHQVTARHRFMGSMRPLVWSG